MCYNDRFLCHFFCCEKLTAEETACVTECGRNSTACATCVAFIAFSICSGGLTLNIVGTTFYANNAVLIPIVPLATFLSYGLGGNLGYNGTVAFLSTREMVRSKYFPTEAETTAVQQNA